ncbi:MAG: hypothetical protein F4Z01_04310 [Gammaproteobacteria bacterium]|nr:hypothetical protein [Gammaproteobacteria bacterium]MYF38906.1 hypothetical protein [Gammaproteobacteria bacterium]
MRYSVAFALLGFIGATCAVAQTFDVTSEISLQGRWYPESPAFLEQSSSNFGMVAKTTLHLEITSKSSFTFTPLYRYDNADSQRTHGDVREAYFLMYGDWRNNSWELQLGQASVYWGVAELYNLVDVVNQVDLVEHPRNRPKLGQPMVHLTVAGDWGIAESFLLPYHRKRTFPGPAGRLRSRFPISENASYEHKDGERHMDVAFRYSNSVGPYDFGLSMFIGTNREPAFLAFQQPEPTTHQTLTLQPHYEQMEQFGVDVQLTTSVLLYKLEAIQRRGTRNLFGEEENYHAVILGTEHTVFNLFNSAASLTVLAEWLYDARGSRATTVWTNDLFLSGFLSFNDVAGTELVAGLLADLEYDYRSLNLEFKRRLSDSWTFRLESIVNLSSDPADITYDGRKDSFLGIDFTFGF